MKGKQKTKLKYANQNIFHLKIKNQEKKKIIQSEKKKARISFLVR